MKLPTEGEFLRALTAGEVARVWNSRPPGRSWTQEFWWGPSEGFTSSITSSGSFTTPHVYPDGGECYREWVSLAKEFKWSCPVPNEPEYLETPCPFCGQQAGIPGEFSVCCESCGAYGPLGHDREHGKALWGMRAVIWDIDTEMINNRTSLCVLINGLNRKCVEAFKDGDRDEAQRLAGLSDTLEEIPKEVGIGEST